MDAKDTAIRLLMSAHKDNILIFEYDVDAMQLDEVDAICTAIKEIVDNKVIFIPKTMTVDSESDVDFLIESYTNVVRFLEGLKTKISNQKRVCEDED